MIPIIISVTDRTQYLPYMLNSLLASKLQDAKIFIHSNKPQSEFHCTSYFEKPMEKQLKELKIPSINYVMRPYSDFCQIDVSNKNQIHVQKVKTVLDQYFNKFNTDFIIYLKDDVIFNENWLQNLLNLYNKLKDKLGFIAGCDLNTPIITPSYTETEQNIKRGYIQVKTRNQGRYGSSQCYLITRSFYNKWKNTRLPDRIDYHSTFNEATDFILNQACYTLGFKSYLTIPQYVQHIGVKTRYNRKKMAYTHLFIQPYCYYHYLECKQ